jgi:AcrR family transcriptional regulator
MRRTTAACQDSLCAVYIEMATQRRYELKKRAEGMEATRRRITETTVELHRTVGPAATQISEIARRSGVRRVTVYNHFPEVRLLLAACSSHWRGLHPTPPIEPWLEIEDPGARLRAGLEALYAWYRETEPMTANVLRDAEVMPALRDILDGGLLRYLDRVRDTLAAPFAPRGRPSTGVRAATEAAIEFHTWRRLAVLGDSAAADLAATMVESAAQRQGPG